MTSSSSAAPVAVPFSTACSRCSTAREPWRTSRASSARRSRPSREPSPTCARTGSSSPDRPPERRRRCARHSHPGSVRPRPKAGSRRRRSRSSASRIARTSSSGSSNPWSGKPGWTRWDGPVDADVVAAAPSPAELPLLERWNAAMLECERPWLQVLPFNGRLAALGPLFVPRETCCHACYRHRRGASLGEPELAAALDSVPAPYPQPALLSTALAALAAGLLVRWLATRDPTLPGTLFALELESGLRVDAHRVLRVPRCPACSAAVAAPLPWTTA